MDQDEIIIDDGDPRNARARIVRHYPGVLRPGTYPAPARQYPVAYPQPMYQPAPQPAYQPAIYPSYQAPVLVQRRGRIADLPTGQSLPSAPAPIGSTETDVANLITYQSALAQHAKRDEQLRTVGALLSKLLA